MQLVSSKKKFVEVEVGFVAKGEAEMKRMVETKSLNGKLARVGLLSLLTFMIVGFATTASADEYKLYHQVGFNMDREPLKHFSRVEKETFPTQVAVVTGSRARTFNDNLNQPFRWVEALQATVVHRMGETTELTPVQQTALKTEVGSDLEANEAHMSDKAREAFKKLADKIIAMKKEALTTDNDKFLEELFSDEEIRKSLGLFLTEKDEKVVVEDTEAKEREAKLRADLDKVTADLLALKRTDGKTGEPVETDADRKEAQVICDHLVSAFKAARDNFANSVKGIASTIAQLQSMSRQTPNGRKRDRHLEDDLADRLDKALADNKPAPAPFSPPASTTPRESKPIEQAATDKNVLDNQIPPAQPPQQDPNANFPWYLFNNNSAPSLAEVPKVNGELPDATGATLTLLNAQNVLSESVGRVPITDSLGSNPSLAQLSNAKAEVSNSLQDMQAQYTASKNEATALEVQIAALKAEDKSNLDPETAEKLDAAKLKYDNAQAALNSPMAMMSMSNSTGGGNPMTDPTYLLLNKRATDAKAEYDALNAKAGTQKKNNQARIKSLAAAKDQLAQVATGLKAEIGKLKPQLSSVQQLLDNGMNAQIAAIQARQGNGANGGVINVLKSFGAPQSGPARSTPFVGATQQPVGGDTRPRL